jgi:hypothetical protein
MGHAVLSGLQQHPEEATLQLDCKNAFNTVRRQNVLDSVGHEAPQPLPLAQWMYCQPSALLVPDAPQNSPVIQSCIGVRQGDPGKKSSLCGPLLFALAIQPMLLSVQKSFHSVRIVAYQDDIVLQGPKGELQLAYTELRGLLAAEGLQIQLQKCRIYSPDSAQASELASSSASLKPQGASWLQAAQWGSLIS